MAIDVRMNGIIHAALRRDLDRIAIVTAEPDQVQPARLRAVGAHARWLMHHLHTHHTTEDEALFPLLRRNNDGAAALLDAMAAEHAAIAAAVTGLDEAGRRAEVGEPGAAAGLREATAALRAVLDPHLEHEERELSPVVEGSLGDDEWEAFEKANIAGKKPPALAFEGHWMLDNLDPASVPVVTGKVPAVPRFVLLRFLGGPYRRRAEACWGGTPAAEVPAVPLAV